MTTPVWVKLYIGENDRNPSFLKIKADLDFIDRLKKEIKKEEQLEFPASRLKVYAAGTSYPIVEGHDILDPGDAVPTDTTSKNSLTVVAPAIVSVSVASDNHDTVGIAFEPFH